MRAFTRLAMPSMLIAPITLVLIVFTGLNWVMDGARGAREVENAVHFQEDGFRHVVADELEAAVIAQVGDIRHTTRKVVVKANHLVPVVQQTFAQVTPQESCTTSN
jgi:hypothetical protein